MNLERFFLMAAGSNGFLAVALGAFGAHGLRSRLADAPDFARRLEIWETAARYHLAHALALGLVAYLCARAPGGAATYAGYLMLAGIAIFCGSLYALTLSNVRALGAITPIGGLCFLAAWVCVVLAARQLPG